MNAPTEKPFPFGQASRYVGRRRFVGHRRRDEPHWLCQNCQTLNDPGEEHHCLECGERLGLTFLDVWKSDCAKCGTTFEVSARVGSTPRRAHSACKPCRLSALASKYAAESKALAIERLIGCFKEETPAEERAARRAYRRRAKEASALRKAGLLPPARHKAPNGSAEAKENARPRYRLWYASRKAERLAGAALIAAAASARP